MSALRATAPTPVTRGSERGGILVKLIVLLFMLVVAATIYLLREPLLRLAGSYWIVDEPPAASDVIVVLSPDNYEADRAARAAELFRQRWAPRLVASGYDIRPYLSYAEVMQGDLVERGVPATAVLRFPHRAKSTREEAYALARLIAEQRWGRVIVVTSNYHTRRARYILRRVLPPEVELRVVAAPDHGYDPAAWWRSRQGLRLFFHELAAFPVALWEMWRSSGPPGAPAASLHRARFLSINASGAVCSIFSFLFSFFCTIVPQQPRYPLR